MNAHGYGTRLRDVSPLTEFWPEGYSPKDVTYYAAHPEIPLDPLARRCLRCKARNCDACLPTGDSNPPPSNSGKLPPDWAKSYEDNARQTIVATLEQHGPQTIYELQRNANMNYHTARRWVDRFVADGTLRKESVEHRKKRSATRINIYSLPDDFGTVETT